MANFGKLDFNISLKPTSAFPLDARCYFESLADAEAAAATAEEAGSTNTIYYYGQKLVVVANGVVTWYTIQPDKTLKVDGSGGFDEEQLEELRENLNAKADLVDGKVPKSQLPDDIGSGGGGVTSWEDIPDKPFYDNRKTSFYSQIENPNPVSFDVSLLGVTCYKVSELVPTRDEIFNSLQVILDGSDKHYRFYEKEIVFETGDFIYLDSAQNVGEFIFANKSGALNFTYLGYTITLNVPETGIYLIRNSNAGIPEGRTYEFILGEIKQIESKYIPENVIRFEYSELTQVDDIDIDYTISLEKSKEIYQKIVNNEVFSIVIWQDGNNFSPIFNHTGGGEFYTIWLNIYHLTYNQTKNGFRCAHVPIGADQPATPFSLRRTPPLEELMIMGEESMIERGLI